MWHDELGPASRRMDRFRRARSGPSNLKRLLVLALAALACTCGVAVAPDPRRDPSPSPLSEPVAEIVANGGSFTASPLEIQPTIDRERAIAIVREGKTGTPTSQAATLGVLRLAKLGTRNE